MLVALIEETLLGASSALSVGMFKLPAVLLFPQDRYKRHWQTALAEKPKVGELQMDWLRSEDLKEVKVATAPLAV